MAKKSLVDKKAMRNQRMLKKATPPNSQLIAQPTPTSQQSKDIAIWDANDAIWWQNLSRQQVIPRNATVEELEQKADDAEKKSANESERVRRNYAK